MATTSKFDFGLINDQIKEHTDQIGDLTQLDVTANDLVGAVNAVNSKILRSSDVAITLSDYISSQRGSTYYIEVVVNTIFPVSKLQFVQVVSWNGQVQTLPNAQLDGAGTKINIVSPATMSSGVVTIRGFY